MGIWVIEPSFPRMRPGALVQGGEVGVQIPRISPPPGDLPPRGGNFAERLRVIGDVRHDDEHVHSQIEGEILRTGERHAGGGDAFDGGVVGEIGKEHRPLDRARTAEIVHEILRFLEGDTDGGKHDGKFAVSAPHLCLAGDLCREFGVRQAAHREHGQLLSAHEGIQSVDGGDARLNKFVGIIARGGIDGLAVDIHLLFGYDRRPAVAGISHSVKHPPEHIPGNGEFLAVSQKPRPGIGDAQPLRIFKELHHRLVAVDFQNLSAADLPVLAHDIHQFVVFHPFDALHEHQGPDNFPYRLVFLKHLLRRLPPPAP